MATIFATRAAVSVRPTVRASAEDKVRPRPFLPSPARHPPGPSFLVIPNPPRGARAREADRPSPASLISDPQAVAAPSLPRRVASGVAAAALSASVALGSPLSANAEIRLPPIDPDPDRCERAYVGNTIGQANAVSDRILDLRKCNYDDKDLSTKTLSGALMVDGSFKGTNMTEVVMSKAYALGADFTGANFTNSVVDRVTFDDANLTNANFFNAVITGATYENTNLTGATFEDALIGKEDVKRLCENPTVQGETRFQIGCKN